jgi:hypothetical protein
VRSGIAWKVCALMERLFSDGAGLKLLIADDLVIFADALKVYLENKYLLVDPDAARRIKEKLPT